MDATMAQPKLLEGEVMESSSDASEIARLRDLNRSLTRELSDALEENERLRNRVQVSDAPIHRLREKLAPFYEVLQAIFGDIEELSPEGATEPAEAAPVAGKNAAVWEAWKQRLGGSAAKCIDALLVHSELNTQQLAIATGLHRSTIPKLIYVLNKAGIINKSGGRFSLKKIG